MPHWMPAAVDGLRLGEAFGRAAADGAGPRPRGRVGGSGGTPRATTARGLRSKSCCEKAEAESREEEGVPLRCSLRTSRPDAVGQALDPRRGLNAAAVAS